jgi:hypothetical protein
MNRPRSDEIHRVKEVAPDAMMESDRCRYGLLVTLVAYSKATPTRKSVRRTTRQGSFNPCSGIINVNVAGTRWESVTSRDAPEIDMSRTVQVV